MILTHTHSAISTGRRRAQQAGGLLASYDMLTHGDAQVLTDLSGNDNHGTIGSTSAAETDDPVQVPEGRHFQGDDVARVTLSNVQSMMFVLRLDAGETYTNITSSGDGATESPWSYFGYRAEAGGWRAQVYTGSWRNGSSIHAWGDWHLCYADVALGGQVRYLVGDSLEVEALGAADPDGAGWTGALSYIGQVHTGARHMDGILGYMAMWDHALTDAARADAGDTIRSIMTDRGVTVQ